ncbi:phosphoribosyltransferase [Pseudolysinimonas sp.]|uniref:phosphoribosyltransferase n=1 Tax=Pseudolysinimonas sp. TaxID=2680009 RepID=UPI003F7FA35C
MDVFRDRLDAGHLLAARLADLRGTATTVLGLPRGGVVVAAEVARRLELPLDVVIVRKLGVPSHPEVAMGAIAEGGIRLLDEALLERLGVGADQVVDVEERERRVLDTRAARLRSGAEPASLRGRTALIVDDGVATGATATVAAHAARLRGAERVIVAAPVVSPDAARGIPGADRVVALSVPLGFFAVGAHYRRFGEVTEDEVVDLLEEAHRREGAGATRGSGPG